MAHDEAVYSDVIITWLGATGVWAYLRFVHRHRTGSTLERNTLLLLYCGFVLLTVRGFYWLFGWGWLASLRIRAEQQHGLTPLSEAASVQLFVERVQAVQPALIVSGAERDSIAALCAQPTGPVPVRNRDHTDFQRRLVSNAAPASSA